ncbi:MAG: hypothetical protein QOI71_1396 [Gaiellales bacterium]|jgi:hypothetical protein|nr:hypothetical protein [Gaiellales bacterium]
MPAPPRADAHSVKLRAIQGDAAALADIRPAALRRACGHVAGDPVLLRRGYRFYRGSGLDLGGFFTRRFSLPDGRRASVALVAGMDVETGAGVLESCTTLEEVGYELTCGPGSVWAIVLTLENATVSWRELNRKLIVGDAPAFETFAAELGGLPLLGAGTCPLCAERAELAA